MFSPAQWGAALRIGAAAVLISPAAPAAIQINGLADRSYYRDQVTFTVPPEAGFVIESRLDGEVIDAASGHNVRTTGYHELLVTKTPAGGGAGESATVRFIIRDSTRAGGNADTGLPTWVPVDLIDSPRAVVTAAALQAVVPGRVPAGLPIPVIHRLTEADGRIARLMATAAVQPAGGATVRHRIWRGGGAGQVPASAAPGELTLRLGWLDPHTGQDVFHASRAVEVLAPGTPAENLSGTLAGDFTTTEPVLNVSGVVTVPAGRTLRITPGTIVRMGPGAELDVTGQLVVEGTVAEPVLFCRADPAQAWGGLWVHEPTARLEMSGAILTGACASRNWLSQAPHDFGGHHNDQPVLTLSNLDPATVATLTDCWLVDNLPGQAFRTRSSNLTLRRCLVQRTTSGGQLDHGQIKVIDSHFVEINRADGVFEDDDNDGTYLTGGAHEMRGSVWCYCKDDGLDAGTGAGGTMLVDHCWLESCWHEGMAWSNNGASRVVTVNDTVALNNGQGVEAGFGSPLVTVERSLLAGNAVGARFGDNYDWTYNGRLTVRDSFIVHNRFHDVWGMQWASWTYRSDAMDITGNVLSRPNLHHPENTVLTAGTTLGARAPLITDPDGLRGIGIVGRRRQEPRESYTGSLQVRLDRPADRLLEVPWRLLARSSHSDGVEVEAGRGTATFLAGQSVTMVPLPEPPAGPVPWLVFRLDAEAPGLRDRVRPTATTEVHFTTFQPPAAGGGVTLLPPDSVWKYYDGGDLGAAAWKSEAFDDSGWRSGPAKLGFGDPVATELTPGRITYYFRRELVVPEDSGLDQVLFRMQRDDGAVVHLNGEEIWRSNMPSGTITYSTFASSSANETAWYELTLPASALRNGRNQLAVEVHQRSADSSDVAFIMEASGLQSPPQEGFEWTAATAAGELYLMWQAAPGVVPQVSDDLAVWQDLPGRESPLQIAGGDGRRFFRLIRR